MMESLEDKPTLATAINDGLLSNLSFSQKLRFAYELASTVSALHSASIVVKVLSDTTVHIAFDADDRGFPIISGLENAREVSVQMHDTCINLTNIDQRSIHTSRIRLALSGARVQAAKNADSVV